MFFTFNKLNAVYLAAIALMFVACGQNRNTTKLDTATEGTIKISVDETYQPLIDSEIKVFESLYPKAHVIASYKPEAECFKDLLNDSARMIIVTRDLNQEERDYIKGQKITPNSLLLAWDALALIVNKENPDSILNMNQVRGIMDGTNTERKWQLVFDNANSSTVRYIMDSINKGKPLPSNTMGARLAR